MRRYKRILLVEDDLRDVELIKMCLTEINLSEKADVVRDGAEALAYLHGTGSFSAEKPPLPAVILLDIKMPKMDGIQVLKHLKDDAVLKTVPVVMLTSSRESKDLQECYQEGVNAYVVKPVKFQEFVRAVREIGLFWAIINELPPSVSRTGEENSEHSA